MITREKRYALGSRYDHVKKQIETLLADFVGNVFSFDDGTRQLVFQTESLTPTDADPAKPNVLLLFSNPHPGSVRTGMFLCVSENRPSPFWWFMDEAGWFTVQPIDRVPQTLKDLFLQGKHRGPFNLFFDCFYDFPTKDPSELKTIFGDDYFHRELIPAGLTKIGTIVKQHSIDAILSFNGQVTSELTRQSMAGFTLKLNAGELLEYASNLDTIPQKSVPIFQTYPAGYNYSTSIKERRYHNLVQVREKIVIEFLASQESTAEAVFISEPSVLFKIGKFFSPDLAPIDLYDGTRGYWKIGKNREQARLAFSVYRNIILEVYEIVQWFPAGTTFSTRQDKASPDRWEFIGRIAGPVIRNRYRNKSVAHYFPPGARNPIRYVNI
jgi:hypothetical protein